MLLFALVFINGDAELAVTLFSAGIVMMGALRVGVGIINLGVEPLVVLVLVLNAEMFSKLFDDDGFGRISLGFFSVFKGVELTGASKVLLVDVVVAEVVAVAEFAVLVPLGVVLAVVVVAVAVNGFELVFETTGTRSESAANGLACFGSADCC